MRRSQWLSFAEDSCFEGGKVTVACLLGSREGRSAVSRWWSCLMMEWQSLQVRSELMWTWSRPVAPLTKWQKVWSWSLGSHFSELTRGARRMRSSCGPTGTVGLSSCLMVDSMVLKVFFMMVVMMLLYLVGEMASSLITSRSTFSPYPQFRNEIAMRFSSLLRSTAGVKQLSITIWSLSELILRALAPSLLHWWDRCWCSRDIMKPTSWLGNCLHRRCRQRSSSSLLGPEMSDFGCLVPFSSMKCYTMASFSRSYSLLMYFLPYRTNLPFDPSSSFIMSSITDLFSVYCALGGGWQGLLGCGKWDLALAAVLSLRCPLRLQKVQL